MPAIGVDVGGTKCLAVVVDDGGAVVAERRDPTPARDARGLLDVIVREVAELRAGAAVPADTPVGVGVPGMVDGDGVLRFAPNLPGGDGLRLRDELATRLGAPPMVDNDATCATWGEWSRLPQPGPSPMVLVTIGTGIGGGFVVDGRLLRGVHGFAGEIGHMVVDPNGLPCGCGQRGCWERYASGSGLGRLAREAAHAGRARRAVDLAGGDPEDVKGEHLTRAAAEGDPEACEVMGSFAWWVALGLANLGNLLDPARIVLGGGIVESGAVLLEPVRAAFADLVEGAEHRRDMAIVPALLGERAGAVGAAGLAASFFS